jgi:hypothetical protein
MLFLPSLRKFQKFVGVVTLAFILLPFQLVTNVHA